MISFPPFPDSPPVIPKRGRSNSIDNTQVSKTANSFEFNKEQVPTHSFNQTPKLCERFYSVISIPRFPPHSSLPILTPDTDMEKKSIKRDMSLVSVELIESCYQSCLRSTKTKKGILSKALQLTKSRSIYSDIEKLFSHPVFSLDNNPQSEFCFAERIQLRLHLLRDKLTKSSLDNEKANVLFLMNQFYMPQILESKSENMCIYLYELIKKCKKFESDLIKEEKQKKETIIYRALAGELSLEQTCIRLENFKTCELHFRDLIKHIHFSFDIKYDQLFGIKFIDIPRTFFKDGTNEPNINKQYESYLLDFALKINRKRMNLKIKADNQLEAQKKFYIRLFTILSQLNLKAHFFSFRNHSTLSDDYAIESCAEQFIKHEEKEEFIHLLNVLKLGTISWKIIGNNYIQSTFPLLQEAKQYLGIAHKKNSTEIIYKSLSPFTIVCIHPMPYLIHARVHPNDKESFALHEQVLATVTFHWITSFNLFTKKLETNLVIFDLNFEEETLPGWRELIYIALNLYPFLSEMRTRQLEINSTHNIEDDYPLSSRSEKVACKINRNRFPSFEHISPVININKKIEKL